MGPEHEGSGKSVWRRSKAIRPYRFNGAGARGLRKMRSTSLNPSRNVQASMGPEHEGSGKYAKIVDLGNLPAGFNGAGARGLRKIYILSVLTLLVTSFNGAGARGLRKILSMYSASFLSRWLQWGRSTRAPENSLPAVDSTIAVDASMGPEHEGSGK